MAVAVQPLTRIFRYAGLDLPDPGAHLTPEQVRELFTGHYPELATATIDGPQKQGAALTYEFKRAVGTKGRASGMFT